MDAKKVKERRVLLCIKYLVAPHKHLSARAHGFEAGGWAICNGDSDVAFKIDKTDHNWLRILTRDGMASMDVELCRHATQEEIQAAKDLGEPEFDSVFGSGQSRIEKRDG